MKKEDIISSLLKSFVIGIFILIGSIIIGRSISNKPDITNNTQRYQMISHGSEIYIIDTTTGEFYSKFDSLDKGYTDWKKAESPFK